GGGSERLRIGNVFSTSWQSTPVRLCLPCTPWELTPRRPSRLPGTTPTHPTLSFYRGVPHRCQSPRQRVGFLSGQRMTNCLSSTSRVDAVVAKSMAGLSRAHSSRFGSEADLLTQRPL